jgi:putative ABC transport system permease protein
MRSLFGIPMEALALGLSLAVGLVLALLVVLAVRNRVLLRLGLRNVTRRPGRALLIVTGLMLGTTIFTSALVTGDTMNRTVRSAVIETLGTTDEVVTARGADLAPSSALEQAARLPYFDAARVPAAARTLRRTGLVDGITPAIVEPVAVQDLTTRRTEARVSLFGADPGAMAGMDAIRDRSGGRKTLAQLAPGEIYLDADGAAALGARPGDRLRVLAGVRAAQVRVAAVVDFDGAGSDDAAVLLPLARAQTLVGHEGEIGRLLVSNRGDETGGADHTAAVLAAAGRSIAGQGLDLQDVKRDGLELADQQADVFVSVFTTFGSFSIVAGVLLIFLIFVMLSAERRTELGIARAIGTRRSHLVQMFTFEGLAYDVGAAALGAALGVAVAFGMVTVLADAFSAEGIEIRHAVTLRSLAVAYGLGVLLTFAIVAISAWRVSVLNIVAAVRGLPEPAAPRGGRRRVALGLLGVGAGVALAAAGLGAAQSTPFSLGVSIAVLSAIPLARAAGVGARAAFSTAGVLLLAWWLLPFEAMNAIAGRELNMDFSAWVISGLMVVAGATWLIVYNADILLGAAMWALGRIRALAPVLRMAMAFPLRMRFRTGVTLAMFTLVVFTIVVGATTSGAFLRAVDDAESYGGGFDVRAETAPQSPLGEPTTAIRGAGLDPGAFRVVGSESVVPGRVRQRGTRTAAADYPVRGFDPPFLLATTFPLAATAAGYGSAQAVWDAMRRSPDLAVVDQLAAPRRANWGFAAPPAFRLQGFYVEDGSFAPVPVTVRDPGSGRSRTLTVIGVLADTTPLDLAGVWTSQQTVERVFGAARATPTIHHIALAAGVDPDRAAERLERALVANGLEAKSTRADLHEAVGASYTLNWLLLGFMGLGLIVGVAALGVISARSVVERRQQIGVLRSIGFRRGMVQLSFLLESSFIALTAIAVGTALGLVIAFNVIQDAADQPSWQGALRFTVPWVHLGLVFLAVYAAALLATFAPAARAARVEPAEALRYE